MTELHFGFEPTPYPDGDTADKIARILESEYHIVEHFRDFYRDEIADLVHQAMADSIETGRIELTSVEELWKQFLNSNELSRLVPGVPTAASRKQTKVQSYRRGGTWVRGYKRLGAATRASFVKTGTYRDSFRAWIEVE